MKKWFSVHLEVPFAALRTGNEHNYFSLMILLPCVPIIYTDALSAYIVEMLKYTQLEYNPVQPV